MKIRLFFYISVRVPPASIGGGQLTYLSGECQSPTEMQPPAGCQGCAEEGACGAAHPGTSLPMADLNFYIPLI